MKLAARSASRSAPARNFTNGGFVITQTEDDETF
jgi:hypothetical protein